MTEFVIQLLTAAVSTVGFGIIFRLRGRYLPIVFVVGGGCYAVYYLFATVLSLDVFVAALMATIFVTAISEALARAKRSPAVIFILTSLIPIVPGSNLFYMMQGLLLKDMGMALDNGVAALKISLGVAGGIITVSVIGNVINAIMERVKHKKESK